MIIRFICIETNLGVLLNTFHLFVPRYLNKLT